MKSIDLKTPGVKTMELQKMRETYGGGVQWVGDVYRWLVENGLFPRDLSNKSRIRSHV